MIRYRLAADGSMFTPRRGRPPAAPEGYEVSEGDPFTFVPILAECADLVIQVSVGGCCPGRKQRVCIRDKKNVDYGTCKACQDYNYTEMYSAVYQKSPNYGGTAGRHVPLIAAILELKPRCVLDIGCGQGQVVKALLDLGINARGVDVVSPARSVIPANNRTIGSVLDLPIPGGYSDVVVCMDMLEHLIPTDVAQALSEIRRVCNKYAVFSVGISRSLSPVSGHPDMHQSRYTFEKWQDIITKAGFKIIDTEFRGPYDNQIICERV